MGIFDLLGDVAKIALAPVEVAANVAEIVVKPIAEVVEEVVKASEDLTE